MYSALVDLIDRLVTYTHLFTYLHPFIHMSSHKKNAHPQNTQNTGARRRDAPLDRVRARPQQRGPLAPAAARVLHAARDVPQPRAHRRHGAL